MRHWSNFKTFLGQRSINWVKMEPNVNHNRPTLCFVRSGLKYVKQCNVPML